MPAAELDWSKAAQCVCPYIRLHPSELYPPANLRTWVKTSVPTTAASGYAASMEPPPGWSPSASTQPTRPPLVCFVRPAPTAAMCSGEHARACEAAAGILGDVDMAFNVFYELNGPKRIAGVVSVDSHIADLEQFIVRFRKNDKGLFAPVQYLLSAHGEFQVHDVSALEHHTRGSPIPVPRGFQVDHFRPLVFSAVNSHALYASAGTYFRIAGFGNDITGNGSVLDSVVDFIEAGDPLFEYDGSYGPEGVGSLRGRLGATYKAIAFTLIPSWVATAAFVCGWVAAGILVSLLMRRLFSLPSGFAWDAFLAIASVWAAMLVLKGVVTLFGGRFGLAIQADEAWRWIFPLKWV